MASDSAMGEPPPEAMLAAVMDASVGRPLASRRELNELAPGRRSCCLVSALAGLEEPSEDGLAGEDGPAVGRGRGKRGDETGGADGDRTGEGDVVSNRGSDAGSSVVVAVMIVVGTRAFTSSCEARREWAGLIVGLAPGLTRLRRGGRTSCPPEPDEPVDWPAV